MKRLAIIDDDEAALYICKKILVNHGHLVQTYTSFYDFEQKNSDSLISKSFDLIISDVRMPEISGLEVVKRIKAKDPMAQILLMTSFCGNDEALVALELGAVDYIAKPFENPKHFNMIVHKWLHFQKEKPKVKTSIEKKFFLSSSNSLKEVLNIIDKVAMTNASILIQGETGVGKEVFAKLIHEKSNRSGKFIAVNSTAIPVDLLESELFGHEKGSFTGAHSKKIGLIEQAQGGTLFLDEIGDLDLKLQTKILRFLQERKIRRVGGGQELSVDVRVLSATHCVLREMVNEGIFREDLLYRLNTINIRIPPLRSRRDDLIKMSHFLLSEISNKHGLTKLTLSTEAKEQILNHSWPGNIREMKNVFERSALMSDSGGNITLFFDPLITNSESSKYSKHSNEEVEDVKNNGTHQIPPLEGYIQLPLHLTLQEVEIMYLNRVLEINGNNKSKTAKELNIGLRTLYRKLDDVNKSSLQ